MPRITLGGWPELWWEFLPGSRKGRRRRSWYQSQPVWYLYLVGVEGGDIWYPISDIRYLYLVGVVGEGGGSWYQSQPVRYWTVSWNWPSKLTTDIFSSDIDSTILWMLVKRNFIELSWGKIGKMPRRGLVAPQNTFLETVLNRWCNQKMYIICEQISFSYVQLSLSLTINDVQGWGDDGHKLPDCKCTDCRISNCLCLRSLLKTCRSQVPRF